MPLKIKATNNQSHLWTYRSLLGFLFVGKIIVCFINGRLSFIFPTPFLPPFLIYIFFMSLVLSFEESRNMRSHMDLLAVNRWIHIINGYYKIRICSFLFKLKLSCLLVFLIHFLPTFCTSFGAVFISDHDLYFPHFLGPLV